MGQILFKRKFMDTLIHWKNNKNKECLLVKGARQIGKTFIIREFAKQNYEVVVELNFALHPEHKDIFNGSLGADDIYEKLSLKFDDLKFILGKTLIFLDEIQDCGNARTALKSLAEDNKYDVIASGSMLGVSYKEIASIPVGYEHQAEMFAMDFEEFLWAMGWTSEKFNELKTYFDSGKHIPEVINDAMHKRMREYIIVGGMPEAVDKFISTKNFAEVYSQQMKIFNSYLDDIAKYATVSEKPKVRACYLSIPRQLAKENKKFQYSIVEKGGNGRKFDNSLNWLLDAGLIKFCNNVNLPEFPLASYTIGDYFKVYVTDIGILTAMHGFELKEQIFNNTFKGAAKGGIYENLIADILLKRKTPLLFYKKGENRQEIEFLLTTPKGEIVPLEVKAGNGATVSLDEFIREFNPPYALKLIGGNNGNDGKRRTLPLYMALFI
jgi:predicted AAA+ superfamily ATPase